MILNDFKSPKIPFTILPNQYSDKILENLHEMSWEDFVILMTESKGLYNKDDAEQLVPVKWKPSEQWTKEEELALTDAKKTYRTSLNISHVTVAFLDLDEEGSLEQAKEKFRDFDYVIHSTFSGRHRMAIRLDKPVKAENWDVTFIHLMAGINGDQNCKNLSRGYLMPSHDLNRNAKPEFEINKGRALTYSDISELGTRFATAETQKLLDDLEERSNGKDFKGVKRHFSLQEMDYSQYRNDDLSYSKFKKRRANQIEECFIKPLERGAKKGERHAFALRVLQAEISRFKENTDFSRTIQFLFRATQEFDKTPLSRGNTATEIPKIIESALIRADIDRSILMDKGYITQAKKDINTGIEVSYRAERDGKWDFPEFTLPKREYSKSPESLMKRYKLFIENFKEAMHQQSANAEDLNAKAIQVFQEHIAKPVIQNELKSNTASSFESIGRFLLHSMKALRVTKSIEQRKEVYSKMTMAYAEGLSASNLEDSIIGRRMAADEIQSDFNKAYILEIAAEYGKTAMYNKRNNKAPQKKEPEPSELTP